ncbi:hypothetical protein EYF80_016721 [Liparis tanakae]|uniref:Uncharacterized protein n=1 Tax=Liparis tanakae TaxID=230148 RepID=A0A4Z2I5K0_9TELE|nr:hypothetical protein EYF80_016721 [Liparis tanakae]
MPPLCQPAQQNASRLESGREKAVTCNVCHHFDELVLTGAQRGEPRAPLREGRPVLQGDPAEDMPRPVGQAGEHPRCGGSEKSFATDVPHSVDPRSVGVLELIHNDVASRIRSVTVAPMFSPDVLGCLPMAQRRQSTSRMMLIFSSPFFSGSLVRSVTSNPVSVLHTDFTWEFFHRSIPEFCSSLVQFVLMKLSKFLNT